MRANKVRANKALQRTTPLSSQMVQVNWLATLAANWAFPVAIAEAWSLEYAIWAPLAWVS